MCANNWNLSTNKNYLLIFSLVPSKAQVIFFVLMSVLLMQINAVMEFMCQFLLENDSHVKFCGKPWCNSVFVLTSTFRNVAL